MKLSNRTLTWLIIIYISTILALSAAIINTKVALNRTRVLEVRLDHLLHMLLFIPWMVLIRWRWSEKEGYWFYFLAMATGFLLACFSEGIQFFIPGRSSNLLDLLANFIGIFIGALILGRRAKKVVSRQ